MNHSLIVHLKRNHAKRRARRRLGITISSNRMLELVKQIQTNQAVLLRALTNSRKVFQVMLDGKPVKVVYDNRSHNIVTFLSDDMT